MPVTLSTTQPHAINVTDWSLDELFGHYPEGARSKSALFPVANVGLPFIRNGRRYLYKRSDRRYPEQFWGEIVAYQVGGLLGVEVPPAFAAYDEDGDDCGALIEWFYEDGKAQFFAGGHFMQRIMPDYDRKKGKQHNFRSIEAMSRTFTKSGLLNPNWSAWWCDAFIFDAVIGNTDRHQDNWGFLSHRTKDMKIQLTMAPLFDNGTSLGHELETERTNVWHNDQLNGYVRRGRHHAKWLQDDARGCGHIEMLLRMKASFPEQFDLSAAKLIHFDIAALEDVLDKLADLNVTVPLTRDRKNLYIKLITARKSAILQAII